MLLVSTFIGVPSTEKTVSGSRVPSQLLLSWSSEQMKQFIVDAFPRLEGIEFQYTYADKNKDLHTIPTHVNTPRALKQFGIGRSAVYIRPAQNIEPTAQNSLPSTTACQLYSTNISNISSGTAQSSLPSTTACQLCSTNISNISSGREDGPSTSTTPVQVRLFV